MAFDDLYQEIILDHYRNPRNFGKIEENGVSVEHENPVCGDQIKLMVMLNEANVVEQVKFSGHGCAISMASASIMTEEMQGKTLTQARAMIQKFLKTMRGEIDPEFLDEPGDLVALMGVIKFPVRVKCATLAWHALADALEKSEARTYSAA
jgi:nitrogen fixation NifU-like protein